MCALDLVRYNDSLIGIEVTEMRVALIVFSFVLFFICFITFFILFVCFYILLNTILIHVYCVCNISGGPPEEE